MGFPKQEYWSGLPFPFPGDLPNPGIKPPSPALQADSLPLSHLGSPYVKIINPQSNFKNNRHIETLCSLSKTVSIHSVDFFPTLIVSKPPWQLSSMIRKPSALQDAFSSLDSPRKTTCPSVPVAMGGHVAELWDTRIWRKCVSCLEHPW